MRVLKQLSRVIKSKYFLGTLGLVAVLIAAHHVYLYFAIRSVQGEIRALGYPTTMDELVNPAELSPDETRTAELYQEAFGAFELDFEYGQSMPVYGNCCEGVPKGTPYPSEALALSKTFLDANAEALDLLQQAARTGEFRIRVAADTEDYFDRLHGSWNVNQREAAWMFSLQNLYLAEIGETHLAVESVLDGISLARWDQALGMGLLVTAAVEGISTYALKRLIDRHDLSRSDLESLRDAYSAAARDSRIGYASATEACYMVDMAGKLSSYNFEYEGPLLVFDIPMLDTAYEMIRKAWQSGIVFTHRLLGVHQQTRLHIYQIALKCIDLGEMRTAQALESFDDFVRDERKNWLRGVALWIAETDCSFFRSMVLARGMSVARDSAASTSAAIEVYRLDHGGLPSNLQELLPDYLTAIPDDPFGNESLLFVSSEDGYAVYSVGRDRTDDGGVGIYKSISGARDLGIRIER